MTTDNEIPENIGSEYVSWSLSAPASGDAFGDGHFFFREKPCILL